MIIKIMFIWLLSHSLDGQKGKIYLKSLCQKQNWRNGQVRKKMLLTSMSIEKGYPQPHKGRSLGKGCTQPHEGKRLTMN